VDRITVKWNCEAGHKIISRSMTPTLVCPNWAITGKYNPHLGRTADSDDWLEPGEQFELLLCPQGRPSKPYRSLQHPASHESGLILPHPPADRPNIPPEDCAYISGAPNRAATHSASFTWEY
jgi:hypothetical protein